MKINLKDKSILKNMIFIVATLLAILLFCSYLSVDAVSVNSATCLVNSSSGANIRKNTATDSKIVCTVSNNTALIVKKEIFKSKTSTSKTKRWYYVYVNGKNGYIRADLVDNMSYEGVTAKIAKKCNYRAGAGTKMKVNGSIAKHKKISVVLIANPAAGSQGSSSVWYKVKIGSKYHYLCSTNAKLLSSSSNNKYEKMSDSEFNTYLINQGFIKSYRTKLNKLHKAHPNWEFKGKKMNLTWSKAVAAQKKGRLSLIEKKTWVVATKSEVSQYLDPRNFLNSTNIFMFENLGYNAKYQTENVVKKILEPTYLKKNKFSSTYFMKYGEQYHISPVHLASRARQETGGSNGPAINGKGKWKKKVVYNPFNIGAYENVSDALKFAYEHGWTTKEKSIKGAANILSANYISCGQNTIYSQKFNFVNGAAYHQYMQNIKAPYSESYTTYNSYVAAGIYNKPFSFIIPIYKSMP